MREMHLLHEHVLHVCQKYLQLLFGQGVLAGAERSSGRRCKLTGWLQLCSGAIKVNAP